LVGVASDADQGGPPSPKTSAASSAASIDPFVPASVGPSLVIHPAPQIAGSIPPAPPGCVLLCWRTCYVWSVPIVCMPHPLTFAPFHQVSRCWSYFQEFHLYHRASQTDRAGIHSIAEHTWMDTGFDSLNRFKRNSPHWSVSTLPVRPRCPRAKMTTRQPNWASPRSVQSVTCFTNVSTTTPSSAC